MLTWVEIDSRALKHNIHEFRKSIGKDVLFMPVIKGNAYGHGLLEIARLCQNSREVDRLCVASLDEALQLLAAKITRKPIFILSFYELDEKKVAQAVKKGVIFSVYDLAQAAFLNAVAKKFSTHVRIHLKIDTGTSRVGVLPQQALYFVKKLQKLSHCKLEGLWTHFAASESDEKFTKQQLHSFNTVHDAIKKICPGIEYLHTGCTAATILYPEARINAVRVGIGLYGLHPSKATQKKMELKPVLSWHTKIIQVKTVPANTKIGYDGTFITKRTTKLAVLPAGYYDGLDRRFSNRGHVLLAGKKYPIIGRICMNLTMVDLTGSPQSLRAGDTVTLLGRSRKAILTADDLAASAQTINYEIIDRINPLLPRIVT
jgi:alanine racemase